MGQVLHGSATTTEAVRRAIQHSQESLRSLAKRYGINQKTVAKWKQLLSVAKASASVLSSMRVSLAGAVKRATVLNASISSRLRIRTPVSIAIVVRIG